jgi:3-oxoadipate enol-lactonase
MPFVQVNDIVHRYVDQGAAEKPALLLANSLGSDLRIWDEMAARLVCRVSNSRNIWLGA